MILILNIFLGSFRGITLFPFIIVRDKKTRENKTVINHEKIHLRQQLEILVTALIIWVILKLIFKFDNLLIELILVYIAYYIFYVCEWLIRLFKPHNAYRSLSWEREAYINQGDYNYLKKRKFYSSFKYF